MRADYVRTLTKALIGVLRSSPVCCAAQGVVCTLHEGDDFGKLALVNDAPRAASIVLREDNCHFLRVDKEDFNRILRVSSCLPSSDAFIVKKGTVALCWQNLVMQPCL